MENNRNSNKKAAVIVAVSLGAAFVLLLLLQIVINILPDSFSGGKNTVNNSYRFEAADYKADIMQDPEYLSLDRYIRYTDGAISSVLTERSEIEAEGRQLIMFADLFDSIIAGDCDAYNSFFTDDYLKKYGKKDRFTMQQVYNITIELISVRDIEEEGETKIKRYEYKVGYMIHKNNGTFRSDVGSDMSLPQSFIVLEYVGTGENKINDTVSYRY